MLWIIAVLLAAILITLLGAWGSVRSAAFTTLAAVGGFALWAIIAILANELLGPPGAVTVMALPAVALIVFGFVEVARGNMDWFGNPKETEAHNRAAHKRRATG